MTEECPYCNAEVEICHDDGYGMDESGIYQQECGSCGKTFAYTTSFHISHDLAKADCLNGAPHKFKPTTTHPKRFTVMRCEDCGEERPLTEQERREQKIDD